MYLPAIPLEYLPVIPLGYLPAMRFKKPRPLPVSRGTWLLGSFMGKRSEMQRGERGGMGRMR